MDSEMRTFGATLGRRALARDWDGVCALLAPWLRERMTSGQVQAFFEDQYRATLRAHRIAGMHYPEYPDPMLGGNDFTTATKLRAPIAFAGGKVRPLPPEVTDDNIRYWMKLELQCSDEQMEKLDFETFCAIWLAVVATPDGLRVGYWSQGAY